MTPPGAIEDSSGNAVRLGRELGRGGEGTVYEVDGQPHLAAKLYHAPPSRDHVAKITAMAATSDRRIGKLAAWPTTTVRTRGGSTVGFLMPKVSGFRPAFDLYLLKSRLRQFPKADWRFLVHAAANAARAFEAVHAAGHVIGDVNHGNLVVGPDATVRLIDCDSFQITSGSRTWFCEVGVPTHQPPEMQAVASYAGLLRTANHDAFGLAVIIFQMLCLARHPYSGRFTGGGQQPTMEEAIRFCPYAYAADGKATLMTPPPGSLPMTALTPQIRALFETAFTRRGTALAGRPTPAAWVGALGELAAALRPCTRHPAHHYLKALSSCPWCDLESQTGVAFFPATFVLAQRGTDGFMALWQQVEVLPQTSPRDPMPPPPTPAASLDAKRAGRQARAITLLASLFLAGGTAWIWATTAAADRGGHIAFLAIITALVVLPTVVVPGRKAKARLAAASGALKALQQEWLRPPRPLSSTDARAELDQIKRGYDAVQAERETSLKSLADNRRATQLSAYLDRFQIATADVKGVGPAKAAALQSHGIDTAADVGYFKVAVVPGFGPITTQALVDWRSRHERDFKFDASKAISAADVAPIESAANLQRQVLERKLASGLATLRAAIQQEIEQRAALRLAFSSVGPAFGQALADQQAIAFHL